MVPHLFLQIGGGDECFATRHTTAGYNHFLNEQGRLMLLFSFCQQKPIHVGFTIWFYLSPKKSGF